MSLEKQEDHIQRKAAEQAGFGHVPMSLEKRDGYIWMDGKLVPWGEARVHVLSHTLHYGLGVFEGIRAYDAGDRPAIFRLRDHLKRLLDSARAVCMAVPWELEQMEQACGEVMRANHLGEAYIRPVCFYGAESLGLRADKLHSHLAIAAWHWDTYLGATGLQRGIRVKTASYARLHPNTAMCRAKISGNYVNSILALQEALDAGYDEALLLDTDGYVAEGSGENLFLVRNGSIYTPEPRAALEGITRDTVFHLAKEEGLHVSERTLTRNDVYIAEEAFFTGTAAEITPIRELDGRPIGNNCPGPLTRKLQNRYFDLVHGRVPRYKHWLHFLDEPHTAEGHEPARKSGSTTA